MPKSQCAGYLKKLSVLCALLTFTAGCSRAFVPLDNDLIQKLGSVKAVSVIPKNHAEPTVSSTGGAAAGAAFGLVGGLVAAAVISAQLESGRKKITGFEENMNGFDFRTMIRTRLREEFDRPGDLEIAGLIARDEKLAKADRLKIVEEAERDAVLFLQTDYYLSPDFRILTIVMSPEIWGKQERKRIYNGKFTYFSTAVEGDDDSVFAIWGEYGGKRYQETIQEGADELSRFLRMDILELKDGQAPVEKFVASVNNPMTGGSMRLRGTFLKKEEDRLWIRIPKEGLLSVPCGIVRPLADLPKTKNSNTEVIEPEEKKRLTHCTEEE